MEKNAKPKPNFFTWFLEIKNPEHREELNN
jgi:hypothetical protein